MSDYTGKLLVAAPTLLDPNFRQSVVLMLGGGDEGCLGLILNRGAEKRISELWEAIFHRSAPTSQLLHLGGPVFGPLMILHTKKEHADQGVFPGLYFSTQKDHIETIVENNLEPYKLFIGNAGWGPSQLHREIDEGAWFIMPARAELVFGDDTELWKQTLTEAGIPILSKVLNTGNIPDDPSLN